MKYLFFIVILFLSFSSCKVEKEKKQDQIPENIISVEQMDEVLIDIHLAEAALKYKRAKGEKFKFYSNQYFDHIFKKHNISKKQFEESLKYYYKHEEQLDDIYENVLEELERIKKEANKETTSVEN